MWPGSLLCPAHSSYVIHLLWKKRALPVKKKSKQHGHYLSCGFATKNDGILYYFYACNKWSINHPYEPERKEGRNFYVTFRNVSNITRQRSSCSGKNLILVGFFSSQVLIKKYKPSAMLSGQNLFLTYSPHSHVGWREFVERSGSGCLVSDRSISVVKKLQVWFSWRKGLIFS